MLRTWTSSPTSLSISAMARSTARITSPTMAPTLEGKSRIWRRADYSHRRTPVSNAGAATRRSPIVAGGSGSEKGLLDLSARDDRPDGLDAAIAESDELFMEVDRSVAVADEEFDALADAGRRAG